jgi:hypothetical protein
MAVGAGRLDAMMETRRIAYHGGGPFVRTLVQALEQEGVTVAARREGSYVRAHREPSGMGDAVNATLMATGSTEAIKAGVWAFLSRFGSRAEVRIEDEEAPPSIRGRHRA